MILAVYTRRVQVVLSPEQFETLDRLSRDSGKPKSTMVREALEQTLLLEADQRRRTEALTRLLALDLPVADWIQIEEEIIRGAVSDRSDG